MKVNESCNDTHLIEIRLSVEDIKNLQRGKLAHIECVKSESTEIFIIMEEK